MIVKIKGHLVEKKDNALVIDVNGLHYEVLVPLSVSHRVEDSKGEEGHVNLIVYHYLQLGPSGGFPVLVGFLSEIEKDFFVQFIKVSGIGPRAAVKALNKPISEISSAIEAGDVSYLKTLPRIGTQKAKEIVAKLQGKIGRFGLIQDQGAKGGPTKDRPNWQQEGLDVLLQLQYKKQEALSMIEEALQRTEEITSTEELLNEIYKQRVIK